MKRVKLVNCLYAKESNTSKIVDLYETPEELLSALPDAFNTGFLKIAIEDPSCIGFVVNDKEKGDWIQVYNDEIEEITEEDNSETTSS